LQANFVMSSSTSLYLKQFGIYVGLRIEFNVEGETVLTTPIFSISICSMEFAARA